MKYWLPNVLTGLILFFIPIVSFAQAPALGTAVNFVLFTTNGAMTNAGVPHLTHLTGNVGSNLAAAISGFGNVDGQMHDFDAVTATCTNDVQTAYNQLNLATPTAAHAVSLGSETLFAGVYQISANAMLNSTLILDAQGNPNAVFIFQIQGTLSTATASKVTLINGGLACNVFWKVEGVVSMASGSTMRGTIIANNAAINLTSLDTLEGRALSINGAVSVSELMAYTPIGCGSAVLTGPAAPALVSAAIFGVFSSIGTVTGTLTTHVIGDIGSNSTTTSGFNPSFVTGTIHPSPDATTAAAAGSLTNVYNDLNTLAADIDLLDPANFGYGLVLTPHTYLLGAATSFTDTVFLNAENDPNAVFIIQVSGQFTTSTLSYVKLINGTQAKNVYWLINGATHIYDNSVFNGTIVGAGAITLNTGDSLNGRALTINGAIAINGNYVNDNPVPTCVAPPINGANHVCTGAATTLSDATTGGIWSSSNTAATVGSSSGIVTGIIPGSAVITYTSPAACVSTTTVTINSGASPITGASTVCVGSSINLSDTATGGAWSSSNTLLATAGSGSGIITGVASGALSITYTIPSGCIATKSVTVGSASTAGTITGLSSVCVGSFITLSDGVSGGTWSSSSNTTATISGGVVTGVTSGIDTIRYRVTSTCGNDTATKTITINTSSNAGTITGASSVCMGSSITLSNSITGGTWSSSNTTATVSDSVVTGAMAGTDIISYSINNGCGLATTTKTVTVNAAPNAGTITGASGVCVGSMTTLSDSVPGGVWSSSSNTTATISGGVVTGGTGGIDTVMYAVTNISCTSTATKAITVSASSGAGSITGPSGACVGTPVTFSDGVTGGTWSSTNATATISGGGVVTGATAGIDTIMYGVNNACGSDTITKIITINPSPNAGAITGASSVCVGLSVTLVDGIAGGTWSSSNTAATVSGGVVTAVTGGIDTIMYAVTALGCTSTVIKTVAVTTFQSAGSISGPSMVCVGSAITLSDSVAGGIWSVSNTIALVGSGMVTGSITGTDTISYTITNTCSTAIATQIITVNPLPNAGAITGASSVCVGLSVTLVDGIAGGTWSSSNTAATVSGGVVTAVTGGIDTIMYAVTALGCTSTVIKTVAVTTFQSAGSISGPSMVCVGSAITLSDSVAGGIWSGSNAITLVAGGMVIGSITGTDTISYTVTNACSTAIATQIITVNPLPNAGSISGAVSVCIGSSIILSDWVAGGIWSSNNSSIASVSGIGTVTAITPGTVVITYAVINSCGTATATDVITVLSLADCNTGVNEQAGAVMELKVYPNPNSGSFFILFKSGSDEPVKIVITNIVGEKIQEITTATNIETPLKLYVPSGVYFLSASTTHGSYTSKVVIGG